MHRTELDLFFGEASRTLLQTRVLLEKRINLSPFVKFNLWLFKDYIKILERQLDIFIKEGLLRKDPNASDYSINRCRNLLEKSLSSPIGKTVYRMFIRHSMRRDNYLSKIICEAAFRNKNIIDSFLMSNNKESIKSIESNLFAIKDKSNRDIYGNTIAQELDAKLCTTFEDISELEKLGHETFFIRRDINDYLRDITNLFANFNIDFIKCLQQYNDFDPKFGCYEAFRSESIKRDDKSSEESNPADKELISYFYNDEGTMNEFLSNIRGKTGKAVAIEMKALQELGKIDLSSMTAFLHLIGIDSNKDGVIRYFRDTYDNHLLPNDKDVASAKKHY